MNADITAVATPDGDDPTAEATYIENQATLAALGNELERLKDVAVAAKHEVETLMLEADRQFDGENEIVKPSKAPGGGELSRRAGSESKYPSQDNITARLTIITAARWADMCFPTNDRNFAIAPTPVPDLSASPAAVVTLGGEPLPMQDGDTERQMTAQDMTLVQEEAAEKAAGLMQKQIDDDLTECHFNAAAREAIDDACRYGTGIIKGPFVVNKAHKVRKKSTYTTKDGEIKTLHEIGFEEKKKPAVAYVDLWDFYPQRSKRIEQAEHAFVRHTLTESQVRKLEKQPRFDKVAVADLIKKGPNPNDMTGAGMSDEKVNEGRFCVWEYHGPFPKKALEAMGCPCDSPLDSISGEVWFSQGIVLKVVASHMESMTRLPFYVINYQRNKNDIFGKGVPWVVRYDQNAVHTLWDCMMVNGILSSGVILALIKGALSKDQGNISIGTKPVEVLNFNGNEMPDPDIRRAIQQFRVDSTVEQTRPLYEQAKLNGEEHAMIPFVVSGDAAKAYGTAYGTKQLSESTNIVQRRFARTTDDDLIDPMIEAMYDWEMLHGTNEAAKGDYCVKALGVSHLLKKEMEAMNFYALLQGPFVNPELAAHYDKRWFAEMAVKVLDMPADQALISEQLAAENAKNQPPPPEIALAQMKEQTQQQMIAFKDKELQFQMKKWDDENKLRTYEAQGKVIAADAKADIQTMAIQATRETKLQKIETDAQLKQSEANRQAFIDAGKLRIDAEKVEATKEKTAASLAPQNPN